MEPRGRGPCGGPGEPGPAPSRCAGARGLNLAPRWEGTGPAAAGGTGHGTAAGPAPAPAGEATPAPPAPPERREERAVPGLRGRCRSQGQRGTGGQGPPAQEGPAGQYPLLAPTRGSHPTRVPIQELHAVLQTPAVSISVGVGRLFHSGFTDGSG